MSIRYGSLLACASCALVVLLLLIVNAVLPQRAVAASARYDVVALPGSTTPGVLASILNREASKGYRYVGLSYAESLAIFVKD